MEAPVGFEPTTFRLTAGCSKPTELRGHGGDASGSRTRNLQFERLATYQIRRWHQIEESVRQTTFTALSAQGLPCPGGFSPLYSVKPIHGGPGRSRTYGVSYVPDLQSGVLATGHTDPY